MVSSGKPTTVSLADEEGVKRILVDTLFGLWATSTMDTKTSHRKHSSKTDAATQLSNTDVRTGMDAATLRQAVPRAIDR